MRDGWLDLLRRRRSIRRYLAEPIADADRAALVEALLRAPSSRGRPSRQFIIVDDPKMLKALARAKEDGSALIAGAPLAVVILGDESVSDVWIEDCSVAATFLQLTAEALGLGSCWVQIRGRRHDAETSAEEYVRRLLNIPDALHVACIVAVGKPAEAPPPRSASGLRRESLHGNRWGKKFVS